MYKLRSPKKPAKAVKSKKATASKAKSDTPTIRRERFEGTFADADFVDPLSDEFLTR